MQQLFLHLFIQRICKIYFNYVKEWRITNIERVLQVQLTSWTTFTHSFA